MKVFKGIVVSACVATLTGCNPFMYPDGPKLALNTRPVALNDAIKAAEDLEVNYLKAAREQAAADKLVKGGLILSAATAIGSALYGAHRDIITGAAFGGATLYAGSMLFGSPQQRAVYRTGAQALSCAVTTVAPLTTVDEAELTAAYRDLADTGRRYGDAVIDLENAIDAVPRPALKEADSKGYDAYNAALGKMEAELPKLKGLVDAATADSDATLTAARNAVRDANKAYADYLLVTANAKAGIKDAKSLDDMKKAIDKAQKALEALKMAPNHQPWMDPYIDSGIVKVKTLADNVATWDTARALRAQTIIDADASVLRAGIDLQAWRLVSVGLDTDRAKAAAIRKKLKDAGSALFAASKTIHYKVLEQLERFEPDHAAILRAFSAVTGVTLAGAKGITAGRDDLFARTPSLAAAAPKAPSEEAPPPEAAAAEKKEVPTEKKAAAPEVAPTDAQVAELNGKIDGILADLAFIKTDDLSRQARGFNAVSEQIRNAVSRPNGDAAGKQAGEKVPPDLKAAHGNLNRLADQVRQAHLTLRDQIEAVQSIDLLAIETICAAKIDAGIKPPKPSTDHVKVNDKDQQYLYVSGGRGSYSVMYDKEPKAITVTPGYDPANGRFRYQIGASTADGAFTPGQTYVLTITDEDDLSATVTVTTE